MSLRDLILRPDYNKTEHDIANEFYLPCMRSSTRYDRITGYFGSTVYIIAWPALKLFVKQGGKIRVISSPYITAEDQEAILQGYSARGREVVQKSVMKEINELFSDPFLDKPSKALACLVALGVIDIKIAIVNPAAAPDVQRMFHDKLGIFQDAEGNTVGFRGSMNETFKGLSADGNIESIDVFPNWMDIRDKQRAENASRYFNLLWDAQVPDVDVYDFPQAGREVFERHLSQSNWEQLVDEVTAEIDQAIKWSADKRIGGKKPRPHQVSALEEWTRRGRRGILEHATGSGKTFTALCAIRNALEMNEVPIILVPSNELLKQWNQEISQTLSDIDLRILLCGAGHYAWKKPNNLKSWTKNDLDSKRIIIATIDTASTDRFLSSIQQGRHLFIVADEVHRIGSPHYRKVLTIDSGPRLALSATPKRYGDPQGTRDIFDYFGDIIPPSFTLEDAIRSGVLVKYMYYPHEVSLTQAEQSEWDAITRNLVRLLSLKNKRGAMQRGIQELSFQDEEIKKLLIKRAKIVKNAHAKIELALRVIEEHHTPGQRWLIYCDNQKQLRNVLDLLSTSGYDAYEYHSAMFGDRNETLRYFKAKGGILVSIRCLDEGVNIPSATHALILASSKNQREFVQRRGRVLRRDSSKNYAYLHDALVTPNNTDPDNLRGLSIIESELCRAIIFGQMAENTTCITKLKLLAIEWGIDLSDIVLGGYEDDEQ